MRDRSHLVEFSTASELMWLLNHSTLMSLTRDDTKFIAQLYLEKKGKTYVPFSKS